jgi:glycopeptide antibiotics resistance protein
MREWAWAVVTDPVTTVAAIALLAAAGLLTGPLARWRRWPVWPTAGVLVAAAVILVLTLLPAPGHPVGWGGLAALRSCARSLTSPDLLWTYGLLSTDDRGERVGNIAMFVPLTFFAVLACRRPLLVAVAGVLLPPTVELAQALMGAGRTCIGYDWVNNATGALIGVLLGVVTLWLARRREPS